MSTLTSDKFGLCLHKWLAVQRLCWIQESKLYRIWCQPPLRNYREIHQTNWFIKRVFLFLRKQERVVSKSQNSSMSISININVIQVIQDQYHHYLKANIEFGGSFHRLHSIWNALQRQHWHFCPAPAHHVAPPVSISSDQ